MVSQLNMKFFAIARISDRTILATECLDKGMEATYRSEAKTIFGKLEDVYLRPEERQKIRSNYGAWFCTLDNKNIVYLALTHIEYPERHAYAMISEIRDQLAELKNFNQEKELVVQTFSRKNVLPIVNKYNDLEAIDQLVATKNKMNQIKEVMKDSINKALENKDSLSILDQKSEDLSALASGFYSSSHELHNKIRARNRRIMIYSIVACVLLLSMYFII